jgi:putative redox protein
MAPTRTVTATWVERLHARVDAGGFELHVDEPPEAGGTGTGPQPTDLFLASVSSCFALAVAWSAAKLGVTLHDLQVAATGEYDGAAFAAVTLTVTSSRHSREELDRLAKEAERVCYVTNTLRRTPTVTIEIGPPTPH